MEILNAYLKPLRAFMASDFYTTRKALSITQMEMADMLDIDLRSYADLEHGASLCSTRVFLRYIFLCKKDRMQFLKDIEGVLREVDDDLLN